MPLVGIVRQGKAFMKQTLLPQLVLLVHCVRLTSKKITCCSGSLGTFDS